MKTLALKVPPDVVLLAVAAAMRGTSLLVPPSDLPVAVRASCGAILAVVGLCVVQAGGGSFRRARTTTDPTRPYSASSLVVSGAYRYTRNPMYVGMTIVLVGWAAFLLNAVAFSLVVVFVVYIDRFQIIPEERALSERFGTEYPTYRSTVRRWL